MALTGFTSIDLNEKTACDFPEDLIRAWLTHVPPTTKGEHVYSMPLLAAIPLDQRTTIVELTTVEAWALVLHPMLMPFWGTSQPSHSLKHDNSEKQQHMKEPHPVTEMFYNCISENIFQKESNNESFMENFRTVPGD